MPVQQCCDTCKIHFAGCRITQFFDKFKPAARLGLLHQQSDREGRIVEMPAKLLPPFGVVHVYGRQGIGIGVQGDFARDRFDEILKARVIVEHAQGRGRIDVIIANAALGRGDLPVGSMLGRISGIIGC